MGQRDRSSATATRLVLGGDDENEMQGSNLDGSDVKQEGEEELRKKREKKKRKLGQRVIWAVGVA